MIYIDELKDLKLYTRPFLLPRNKDKRLGGLALLLTPNYESSIGIINSKYLINKYYNSYYLEKDVSLYINSDGSLHRPVEEQYIHESISSGDEVTYIEEGVYKRYKEEIIYNGYNSDVIEIKRFINRRILDEYNKDLRAPIKYPISVTVYNNTRMDDMIDDKDMLIQSRYMFINDEEYTYYIKECIYEFLVRCLNPKVNDVLCEAISMVLAGTYEDSKEWIMNNTNIYYLCDTLLGIVTKPNGYHELRNIIKKNDIREISKKSMEWRSKQIDDIKDRFLDEAGGVEELKRLKRKMRYSARKGSVHITNRLNRVIDSAKDGDKDLFDFNKNKKKDDDNLSSIKTPNLADIKGQIQSMSSPKTEAVDDEEYRFLYNEVITEDYIRMSDCIQFFTEANMDPRLYKILYKERLRNNRDVQPIYDQIKQDCPAIKNTKFSLKMYKRKNLFVDLYYYNERYFINSNLTMKKGLNTYLQLLDKMINNNSRYKEAGYDGKRVLFIPVNDWDINPNTKMWLYTKDINPISLIYELLIHNKEKLKEIFGNMETVFISNNGYFKVNFSKLDSNLEKRFLPLIKKLRFGEPVEEEEPTMSKDSKAAIVDTIIDNIEDSKNIKIYNLTGKKTKDIDKQDDIEDKGKDSDKKEIKDAIEKAAQNSNSVEDTLEKLDSNDAFKLMVAMLDDGEAPAVKLSSSRTARIDDLDKKLLDKKVRGKTVKELLEEKKSYSNAPLEKVDLKVDSINQEWHEMTYPSLAHQYNIDADIVAILEDLKNKSYPISIVELEVVDNSTTEDYIVTYVVKMENHVGKRWTYKFDIPIMVNDQYMILRGNKKVISTQSFLMPIIKTDEDTAQIITNYNKIFIRRFGNGVGKSNQICDKIIKALSKNEFKGVTVNWTPCDSQLTGFDLPIDYIDFASAMESIIIDDWFICFNIRHFIKEYDKYIDLSKGIPIAINTNQHTVLYAYDNQYTSNIVYDICTAKSDLIDAIKSASTSTKYIYSKASILNTEIPLIIVAAYTVGLTEVLQKARFTYNFVEKKSYTLYDRIHYDWIKFSDGFLVYQITPSSSLLLNGLKESPTDMYSISEMNNKTTYLDFLDNYGGRLKADGIDNFYDCLIDPITRDTLEHYKFPTDYIEVLLYANNLLTDNKYFSHSEQAPRRFRKNELIAGYAYKCIALSYSNYATQTKHGREVPMTIKQSAVIDAILLDPSATDLSTINALNEKEMYDAVTTKGLSGLNSERSYSLDKRAYDDSMINILSMSTGFASTVGINRQATLNASIDTSRGYIKPSSIKESNSINSLCMSEALTPMGTTRDDPFRSAMTFIQTTRHEVKVKQSDPLLVTNGADEALPYLISDIFCHKAKYNGEVVEIKPDDYMIIKYKNGTSEYVELGDKVEKNSSVGKYTNVKLTTTLKKGSKVKQGDIIAFDEESFDPNTGIDNNPAYKIGTLAKAALMDTDEGFEDSAITSSDMSEAMSTTIIKKKEINIPKSTNVYNLVEVGTAVEEGDTLLILQSSFDEDDANILLKNLTADEKEVSELGRKHVTSSVTGWVHNIELYRTVDLDELSPSLKKIFTKYEKNIAEKKKVAKANGVSDADLNKIGNDYKLDATGKLKNSGDGVKIIIHLAYEDKFSVGDKLVYWSANKGVKKDQFPKGEEPYSLDRPNEKIHSLIAIASVNGRMVTSIMNIGVINRLLIEATRKAKDILGIPYDENLL